MRSTSSSLPARRTATRRARPHEPDRRPASSARPCRLGRTDRRIFDRSHVQAEASRSRPVARALTMALASFTTARSAAPILTATGTDQASTDMRDALASADASVAAAPPSPQTSRRPVWMSGEPETTVDTAALEKAADRLEGADLLPVPFVLGLISDVNELVAPVNERVAGLRGSLERRLRRRPRKKQQPPKRHGSRPKQAAAEAAAKATPRASSGGARARRKRHERRRGASDRPRHARRLRLGRRPVLMPGVALEQGVRLELPGLQPLEWCHGYPPGAPGKQDGVGRC